MKKGAHLLTMYMKVACGIPHSIKGLNEGAEFLLVFDDGDFSENSTFTITDWFANTPKDVLAANFGVSEEAFDDIPNEQVYIIKVRFLDRLSKNNQKT